MRRCGYLSVSPRVSPAEDAPDAVATVLLSGPNGGTVGTGLIDAENARILLRDLTMITTKIMSHAEAVAELRKLTNEEDE